MGWREPQKKRIEDSDCWVAQYSFMSCWLLCALKSSDMFCWFRGNFFFFLRVNIEFNFDLIVCQMFCIWLWELFFYDFAHNAVLEEVFICPSDSPPVVSHCYFSAACLPSQLQFFIVTVHTAYNLFADCDFPDSMNMVVLAYSLSLIALFSNFYYHSYLAKKKSKKT